MRILKVLAVAAGLFGSALTAYPLPAAVTPAEIPGSGPWKASLPENTSLPLPILAASPALFLPLVLKPVTPGVIVVLIDNFLLFVPAPLQ